MEKKFKLKDILGTLAFVFVLIFIFFYFKKTKPIYFWSEVCPECKVVEDFLKENKTIQEKLFKEKKIEKKEVSFNPKNARELTLIARKCGINSKEIPVPLVWDGKKCIIGNEAVIEFFKQQAK